MHLPIYLDYSATTPCLPEVVEAMLPYFSSIYGNATSKQYVQGWLAEEAIDQAREQVASLIKASPKEVVFTSGASETINWVLKGYLENFSLQDCHIITVTTEHKAVLATCSYLEKKGVCITYLPVDPTGHLSVDAVQAAIQPNTKLICVMLANNETGVIQDLPSIYQLAKSLRIAVFTDATQAVGKIPIVASDVADFMCFSAHKMYGPKGAGALFINRTSSIKVHPLLHGGGQEKQLRSGTLNVPALVGFGKAAEIAQNQLIEEASRLKQLKDHLENTLSQLPYTQINGSSRMRLPHISNITFGNLKSPDLLSLVTPKLAVSSGAACSSVTNQPSHVLTAMAIQSFDAINSIRFSLGKFTTPDDIQLAIDEVTCAVQQLSRITFD